MHGAGELKLAVLHPTEYMVLHVVMLKLAVCILQSTNSACVSALNSVLVVCTLGYIPRFPSK